MKELEAVRAKARQAKAALKEESDRIHREQAAGRHPDYDHYSKLYMMWRSADHDAKAKFDEWLYSK